MISQCSMSGVKITPHMVLKKMFKDYTINGHGSQSGHVPWAINVRSAFQRRLHINFGFNWPSGSRWSAANNCHFSTGISTFGNLNMKSEHLVGRNSLLKFYLPHPPKFYGQLILFLQKLKKMKFQ